MRSDRIVLAAIAAALLYGVALPARAGGGLKPHVDEKRGFSVKVPDTFKLNPPKPTGDAKCNAGEFYDDQAKYKSSGSTNPEFKIMWWSTPKAVVTPGAKPTEPAPEPKAPTTRAEAMDEYGPKSVDEIVDQLIEYNTNLFGSNKPPMSDRWATGKAGKTNKQKIDFQYVEINTVKPKEKDKNAPVWCLVVARLKIERPLESVSVGFYGTFAKEFVKDLLPAYLNIIKSFETRDATGVKVEEEPTDPAKWFDWFKRTKVIPGWKFLKSPKGQYAVVYDEGVKDDLAREIASEIEAIRGQVYETLFPPDKPVTTISTIRVCKDPEQYRAYGGSGGSAGYWSWIDKELVFYKDSQNPKDALRVLYHEAFHQYIFYSVGAVSPHSWFNEGHGDYFAGHNYSGGKFDRDTFSWRKDLAAQLKREKRTAPLKVWLTWSQSQYYGAPNEWKLDGGENYALGWSFIYFLRSTKKPEYQGILGRYFNTLKTLVTKKREERRLAREKAKAAGEDVGAEEPEAFANMSYEDDWCDQALKEGLKGVDLDQLEKDWLADSP